MALPDRPDPPVAGDAAPALPASLSLLAASAALLAVPAGAAEPPPLDEEFLEYLAQLEGDEDDWTWFEAEQPKSPPAAARPAASKPATTRQPAAKAPPTKTPTEVKR